ncbi:cation antiporter (Na+/Ca2+) [Alkalihalophilus pseudofirmus OF4]|uniref:Cation antiporter (Na+/Ca2+) n=1 Tax=Alkalihalophilus pseudofirmus (strain ATCC BAA-2126 / JCM 17055 / OF4) TaxID=398511 RepID=D3FV31_ALKPO|nr:sodium:calcium antiporter [Alkalihalophilus pseudofirmus]ADC48457.1 cation antiporter (Na+/Ca2+) [Alkalihalophilus pseudofirmus OF4]
MVFVWFIIAAIITVLAAIKLSTYADTIGEKSSLGGMVVGTIFLAGATSLPEVTTSVSAIVLDNPDIAVGNVFGSNMFNLLIIACFDLYFRKQQIFRHADHSHFFTASLGLLLAIVALLALTIRIDISFLNIGVDIWILITLYGFGVWYISKMSNKESKAPVPVADEEESAHDFSAIPLKTAIIGFIIAAVVIMGAGTLLTVSGDKIAVVTGLGSSFVGSFLIAATTSLPEAVSVLVALQLRNYNLAIGSILGSNLFNILILGASDIFYQKGSIISAVSSVHQITAAAVAILCVVVLYSLVRKPINSTFRYALPSIVLIALYFVSSYLIFVQ